MAKIKKVTAENYGPIKFMSFAPSGYLVEILGMNGEGKSRTLKGIRSVLLAEKDGHGDIITHGEDKASFTVELEGGMIATMRWRTKGEGVEREFEVVEIKGEKNGRPVTVPLKKPRAVIEAYVGEFHDITEITKVDNPERERWLRDVLLKSAGISTEDADGAIEQAKAVRKDANFELTRLQAKMDGLERPATGVPDEEVSAAELMAREREMREALEAVRDAERKGQELLAAVEAEKQEGLRLRKLIEECEERYKAKLAEARAHVVPAVDFDQAAVDDVREQIAGIDKTNAAVRHAREYRALEAELKKASAEAAAAEAAVREATEHKAGLLDGVTLPIPGAAVTDDGVTFRGERFHNLSRSERIVVGVGLGIATRNSLDVLLVDDAEGIDRRNKDAIREMAKAANVQVVMAKAVEDQDGIFVIGAEDVHVESAA